MGQGPTRKVTISLVPAEAAEADGSMQRAPPRGPHEHPHLLPILLPDHELEPGTGVVDRAILTSTNPSSSRSGASSERPALRENPATFAQRPGTPCGR